jgi:hypothetical protein
MTANRALKPALVVGLAMLVAAALPAAAQDDGTGPVVEVHGFGGWAYAETDGNRYLIGTDDGNYKNASFALNVTGKPSAKLTLVAQVELETSLDDEAGEQEVELEYAFAEWAFSDALRLRVGRGKHPFGLYGEVFEVGTLRPFYLLPQGVYGPNGFTSESYDGLGIVGSRYGVSGWGIQYDVYAGQLVGELDVPNIFFAATDEDAVGNLEQETQTKDLIGLRLVVTTPVEGLSWGLSGYRGKRTITPGFVFGELTYTVYGAQIEYAREPWTLRAEYAHNEEESSEAEAGYFEAAYKLSQHWQVAARWDWWELDLPIIPPGALRDFYEKHFWHHEETAIGLNYWFSPNFVLKASYHMAEGNRFAFPDDPAVIHEARLTFPPTLTFETDMVIFGGQFSF